MGHPEEIGDQIEPYFRCPSHPVVPSAMIERQSIDNLDLLRTLLAMAPSNVNALVRAARLYQDALWLCESEPELSWLLLVSAVESAANEWKSASASPIERLQASKVELFSFLQSHSDATLLERIANEFKDSLGSTDKFVKFCLEHDPGPPTARPSEWAQFNWAGLKEALRKVYGYRSKALHDGRPFPAPMCDPPLLMDGWGAPSETLTGIGIYQSGSTWLRKDVPFYLHVFEYISRNAILSWWRRTTPPVETVPLAEANAQGKAPRN